MSKSLTLSIEFEVPAKIIFNALTDKMEVRKFTRSDCQIDFVKGGKFSWMEGKIQGIFEEIDDKNFKLVQKWKFDDWNNFSDVVIQIKDYDDSCKVTVNQTNIPSNVDISFLEKGWNQRIFKQMSQICGYPINEE